MKFRSILYLSAMYLTKTSFLINIINIFNGLIFVYFIQFSICVILSFYLCLIFFCAIILSLFFPFNLIFIFFFLLCHCTHPYFGAMLCFCVLFLYHAFYFFFMLCFIYLFFLRNGEMPCLYSFTGSMLSSFH